MPKVPFDWRGTPITLGARVLFPRKWGLNTHSTEMVEGTVKGFTPAGRVKVQILRSSRPRPGGAAARPCYAVPAHSLTVFPGAGIRPPGIPRQSTPMSARPT
ncbi:hypothetical protein [Streptomyces sp. NPDC089919]|uniref:hypothetical protein n=1 Tax=Streptomyces sp. NPDC089919 TaxID=3155188 RepID=UPI00343D5783